MDSQELRNLSEAYLEVYQEIDEAGRLHTASAQQAGFARIKAGESGGAGTGKVRSDDEIKKEKGGKEFLDRLAAAKKKMKEQVDIYDVILSHLIDEGYASTEEAATAIMVNMSEEWRDSVVEGYVDWRKGSLTVPSRVKGNKRTQSPEERAGDSQFRKYADAQTTRGTQAVRGARGKKARLAAKQQEVIQKTTQNYNEKNKG
jgi:hypothetical protein